MADDRWQRVRHLFEVAVASPAQQTEAVPVRANENPTTRSRTRESQYVKKTT
jgi:hypothetical protein